MARGRLISKSLSTSAKFAELQTIAPKLAEFCQSLYMLLVAHSDDFGRQAGDVFTVKHVVCPASTRAMRDVEAAIMALHNVGLIVWYDDADRKCIQINDFDAHQPGLSRRTESKFTAPTGISVKFTGAPGNSLLTEQNLTEQNGTEVNRTVPALKRVAFTASPDGFDAFWQIYPKKKKRPEAERAWLKLAPDADLRRRIAAAVAEQRTWPDWTKDGGQFVPLPASWLNGRRWEDEATEVPRFAGTSKTAGNVAAIQAFVARTSGGGQ